jgi:hypothetical protein
MTKGAKNVAGSFKEQVDKLCGTLFQIISAVVFSSLAIASLIVGLARKSECPLQPKIPLWLIVYGGVVLGFNAIMIVMVRESIH